jgi:hypothetical protein
MVFIRLQKKGTSKKLRQLVRNRHLQYFIVFMIFILFQFIDYINLTKLIITDPNYLETINLIKAIINHSLGFFIAMIRLFEPFVF